HGEPGTNQTHFSTAAPDGVLVHEVLHYLGLPEGYHDPDALLRRQLDSDGPMGEHAARGGWTLSAGQLPQIDGIAHHGPARPPPAIRRWTSAGATPGRWPAPTTRRRHPGGAAPTGTTRRPARRPPRCPPAQPGRCGRPTSCMAPTPSLGG